MIWGSFVIPIVFVAGAIVIKKQKIRWFEMAVPILLSMLIILAIGAIAEHMMVTDTEYWTGYVENGEHYEAWDEEVPCRHAKYKTVTKTRTNNGKTETYTESVFDGYEHAYDVDYHPEYWEVHDNTGQTIGISKQEFQRLTGKFGNHTWVNLNRHYHSINGNKWVTSFPGDDARLECCSHTHSFENRIQASNSILKFRTVDQKEKALYGLYDYPELTGYSGPMVIGHTDPAGQRRLEILNARLGKPKQVRVWVVVFHDQPLDAAYSQEAYWGGSNKNELILMVGLGENNKVDWGHVASWTLREDLKVNCRNLIYDQKTFDLSKLVDDARPLIEKDWERRHFKEFKNLSVEAPFWLVLVAFGVVSLANGGLTAAFYYGQKERKPLHLKSRFPHKRLP